MLVADDRVEIEQGVARPPDALSGLLEVRGLGIVRMPFLASARLRLAVQMGHGPRLPEPRTEPRFGLPLVHIDPSGPSAAQRVALALDLAMNTARQMVGAFA